ncbi:MAG: hypothetical protein AAGG11_15460 [Pseudomonadota bacterium]
MSVPQRFLASSVRGAMSEAKRALGPEALIIEHRLVNGRVELLAMAGGQGDAQSTAAGEPVARPAEPVPEAEGEPAAAEEAGASLIEEIELALPTVPESAGAPAAELRAVAGGRADEPMPPAAAERSSAEARGPQAAGEPTRGVRWRHDPGNEVGQVLEGMGFSADIQSLLSDQALTPRLAINELLTRCRYSSWPQASGVLPVIGGNGAGVTTSLLRLALELRNVQPRLRLHGAISDTLAGSEKLLLGAQLLALEGTRLTPDGLRAAVANQVPAELALLDLSLSSYRSYASSLRLLQRQGLLTDLVLVVPLHWQATVYLRELADVDLLWDHSCTVHLVFTGADRSAGIAPWLELALRNDWSLSHLGAAATVGAAAEQASPAALRRLLRPQIDRPEASTIFTEELPRERGA